jgi:hypothetical protein
MYYAFNTGTTINPLLGNEYATPVDNTVLVLRKRNFGYGGKSAKPIVLTGSGHGYKVEVGGNIDLTSDQGQRFMGTYQVIGIAVGRTVEGEVPNKKFTHYVMK